MTAVQYEPSGLPTPGQGPCGECGHGSLIHGDNRCHYEDVHTPLCRCKGYRKRGPTLAGEDMSADPAVRRFQIRQAMGLEPDPVDGAIEKLHAEIRTLNDALTEALARVVDAGSNTKLADVMRARYGRECEQWRHNHDQRKAERDALQSHVDWIKAQPFVSRRDYDIAMQTKDEALKTIDRLTKLYLAAEDKRAQRLATERLAILQALGDAFSRMAYGPEEREALSALYAHLAEHGKRAHSEARQIAEAHRTARREP